MFWRRKGRSDREVEEQAGRLLCTYAGIRYSQRTAKHLAEVIRGDRWIELNAETTARLKLVARAQLETLASDVLD